MQPGERGGIKNTQNPVDVVYEWPLRVTHGDDHPRLTKDCTQIRKNIDWKRQMKISSGITRYHESSKLDARN